MKKIISIVLNNFTNDSRVLKIGMSLKNLDCDVTILALGSKEHPYYEIKNNLKVKRIKTIFWENIKSLKLAIMLLVPLYLEIVVKMLIVLFHQREGLVAIHCNDLKTLPIGVIYKIFTVNKIKIIYDCHEYESEVNGPSIVRFFNKILERVLIRFADRVITVSESIAEEYVRLYNVEKPAVVMNCPSYRVVVKNDYFCKKYNLKKYQKIYLYQGGLTSGRGIVQTLEAFKKMSDDRILVVMGYGPYSKVVEEASNKHRNIFYHPAVSPDVLLEYTSSADYGLCLIENLCLSYYYCLPNKLFEYIMADVPVIVSNLFELKKLVSTNEIGVVADNLSIDGISNAVLKTDNLNLKNIETKLSKLSKELYNWEQQEIILFRVYNSMINNYCWDKK